MKVVVLGASGGIGQVCGAVVDNLVVI